ncbi:MAG: hypothetical protein OXC01_02130 [Immundisolibacterales bacterium]|nr:hypothetical protein [Immundisolibacterales bacterium]
MQLRKATARGAGVMGVAALLVSMLHLPPASAEQCPPAKIRILPSYEAPQGFAYAPGEELGTAPGPDHEVLGVIETSVGWDVDVGIRQRCRGEKCELCVNRVKGKAGFEPGRTRVTDRFRGDACRTDAVLAHEARHSQVFDESTRAGVRTIVIALTRWAAVQTALVATPETVEAAAQTKYAEVEEVMREGVASIEREARTRNERIDNPRAYEAEREEMERRCRESR